MQGRRRLREHTDGAQARTHEVTPRTARKPSSGSESATWSLPSLPAEHCPVHAPHRPRPQGPAGPRAGRAPTPADCPSGRPGDSHSPDAPKDGEPTVCLGRAGAESGCGGRYPTLARRRRGGGAARALQYPWPTGTWICPAPPRRGSPAPSPALGPPGLASAGNRGRCYATPIPRRRRQQRVSRLPGPGCMRTGPGLSPTSRPGPIWTQGSRPNQCTPGEPGMRPAPLPPRRDPPSLPGSHGAPTPSSPRN